MPYKDKDRAREYNKEYLRKRHKWHKEQGLCYDCNKEVIEGYTLCPNCSYKHQIHDRKYREENRESLILYQRKNGQKRLEESRCYSCGAPLIEDEIKYCFACVCKRDIPIMKGVLKYETAD